MALARSTDVSIMTCYILNKGIYLHDFKNIIVHTLNCKINGTVHIFFLKKLATMGKDMKQTGTKTLYNLCKLCDVHSTHSVSFHLLHQVHSVLHQKAHRELAHTRRGRLKASLVRRLGRRLSMPPREDASMSSR